MKKTILLLAALLFVTINASAYDIRILANNKEANSNEVTRREISRMNYWVNHHQLETQALRKRAQNVLMLTMKTETRINTNCELGIISHLMEEAIKQEVIDHPLQVLPFLTYLRMENIIDDIFYKMLRSAANIQLELDGVTRRRSSANRSSRTASPRIPDINLNVFYAPIKQWPDDIKRCSLDVYFNMANKLGSSNERVRDAQITVLNAEALKQRVIDRETFNKLETLKNHDALGWSVYFKRYADIVNNAKDKLTSSPELVTDNIFSETYLSRKDKITRRTRLYKTYSSVQVMMLAQLIERTAKRIDSREVSLHFQYTDDPNGENETYIFSPMEQYRASVNLLRRDMAELMRSESFRNTGLEYQDLIAAAYETGFIRSEELDFIVKFEDFWNPKTPRWKTYANFAFSLGGTAALYLPPPWNVIGAIGLVLSQSKIIQDDKLPDSDNNWNVII